MEFHNFIVLHIGFFFFLTKPTLFFKDRLKAKQNSDVCQSLKALPE